MATILTGDATHDVDAAVHAETVLISPDALPDVAGWELKPGEDDGRATEEMKAQPTRGAAEPRIDQTARERSAALTHSHRLCRDDVCVPVRNRSDLLVDGRVDLRVVAEVLGRPLAVDVDTCVVALGESYATPSGQLTAVALDDLELRDVDGRVFSWASLGRRKKVLVAWASW
jgi:hypothetical protein